MLAASGVFITSSDLTILASLYGDPHIKMLFVIEVRRDGRTLRSEEFLDGGVEGFCDFVLKVVAVE